MRTGRTSCRFCTRRSPSPCHSFVQPSLHLSGPSSWDVRAAGVKEGVIMRKVVLYELLSLDGVADHPVSFFLDFDDVMRENLRRVIADQDIVLLGRRTYDDWAEDWPGSDIEPFASFINKVRKYVVTSSPRRRWRRPGLRAQRRPRGCRYRSRRLAGDLW